MELKKIREFLESGDKNEKIEAMKAIIDRMDSAINQMPICSDEFLGDELYRAVVFVTEDRPFGEAGDEW